MNLFFRMNPSCWWNIIFGQFMIQLNSHTSIECMSRKTSNTSFIMYSQDKK